MNRIIFLTILLPLALSVCSIHCQSCKASNTDVSIYACLSCFPDNDNTYLSSCGTISEDWTKYLVGAVLIIVLHLFMLSIGMGVYRQIFQNIQLATLVTWRYQFEKGAIAIQTTNFALITSNNFIETFGIQFIIFLLLLVVFLLVLALTDKNLHSPTAMLLRRKKVIFPIRLITLIYNVLLLSSLAQVSSVNDVIDFQPFSFSIAILALVVVFFMLVGVGVISNWKKFQVDDPHYYVLLQEMTSKKWYAKNNVLISLLTRTLIICIYVGMYSSPSAGGIIVIILQVIYTIYFVILIRFTKIRYFIFRTISHLLLIAIMTTSYIGSVSDLSSPAWQNSSLSYVIFLMGKVIFFFWITIG